MSKDDKTAAIAPENNSDATQVLSATEEATEVVPQAPVAGSVDSTELVDSEETAVMGSNDATAVIGNQYAPDQTQAVPVSNRGHIGAAAPVRLQVGDVLKERFELKRKLGEGGMGAVFLAIDRRKVEAQHQKPEVALKLIHGEFAKDSRAFIALQRETDKSQTLAHPNIITVYDFDRDGDTFFMTMEALTGTELSSLIKQASSDRRQYISFIEDLAKGIAYAHQRNIVHSDLKPANIFITQDQKLKILDFGIARALAGVDGNVDRSGEVSGLTPGYASCEMFERQDPHPADDVYAIGLIAYEVLTGEHPYGRKKSIDARKEGLKPKKIKGIPAYKWQAIARALNFDQTKRQQNAEEFFRQFSGAGRRVRQLSAGLLAMTLSFGLYTWLYEPEAGPDIPFAALPLEIQQEVNNAISEARQARSFGDVNGALFYLEQAYQLHPRNANVMGELDQLLQPFISEVKQVNTSEQAGIFISQLDELLKYEALSQNPELRRLRDKLVAIRGQ